MSSSTTVRTARRRTLRVAAAALTAAAALALTACSGSDATGTGSAGHPGTSTVATEAAGPAPSVTVQGAGPRTGPGAGAETTAGAAGKQTGGLHTTTARTASPVRTQRLTDGSTAEIHRLGDQHYRAKIVSRGSVPATMETKGSDAGLDANGVYLVLSAAGVISAHG
ncbi:hypothetical protein ACH4Q6_22340 [Streptomyces lydicus]|uniref:hypothetical protein n=1 Tax=Streptomyces lydicus TaxID=47763 RepID=UPI0037ABDB08